MIYKVNYMVSDVEAFKASKVVMPEYVVAASFKEALKKALTYETAHASLLEVALHVATSNIAVATKYKGI